MSDSDGLQADDYFDPLMDGDFHGFVTGSGKDPVWNFFAGSPGVSDEGGGGDGLAA